MPRGPALAEPPDVALGEIRLLAWPPLCVSAVLARIRDSGGAGPGEGGEAGGGRCGVGGGPGAGLDGVVPPQDSAVGPHGEPGGDRDEGVPVTGGGVNGGDAPPGQVPSQGISGGSGSSPAGAGQRGAGNGARPGLAGSPAGSTGVLIAAGRADLAGDLAQAGAGEHRGAFG
jgi:hypothetical protein